MKRMLTTLLIAVLVSVFLAACVGSGSPESVPDDTVGPDWCVTATPAAVGESATGASGIATVAGRTAPSSGAPGDEETVSPSDLATREALLEHQNLPVEVPTGQPGAPSLPVCPTVTPTQ